MMLKKGFVFAFLTGILFFITACGDEIQQSPVFYETENPTNLSDWNILHIQIQTLYLSDRVVPYDLNSPLFTDYAHKLRTVWLPEGTTASYRDKEALDFPVGTIISKTFYYPTPNGSPQGGATVVHSDDKTAQHLNPGLNLSAVRLMETRLLVHRKDGWVALPYVWTDDQSDAILKRTGDIKKLELIGRGEGRENFAYIIPNANQCAGCHATNATTRDIAPIGPKARHLNKDYPYADGVKNQLVAWQDMGILVDLPDEKWPQNVDWKASNASLNKRARSYLDINCSHCHNPVGAADTSGLLLEPSTPDGTNLGRCKIPIAAGTGTGNRIFDIVPGKPDASILTYRMHSTNPAVMMPELGRSLSHTEGVALISEWITAMNGTCE